MFSLEKSRESAEYSSVKDKLTFSQILKDLLEDYSKPKHSSRENRHFPSEMQLGPLFFSAFINPLNPRTAASRRYGLKAKSRFERRAHISQPPLALSMESLGPQELAALAFLGFPVTPANTCADNQIAEADIRRMYRRHALNLHPDRSGGSADLFRQLQQHYEVLTLALRRTKATVTAATDQF